MDKQYRSRHWDLMTYQEQERLIVSISCSDTFIKYFSPKLRKFLHFIVRPPTVHESAVANYIYDEEYSKAKETGLMTEIEAIDSMIFLGQWDRENDNKMETIKQDIYKIKKGLLELFFHDEKLQRAKKMLRKAEDELVKLFVQKHNLLQNTAETHATISSQRYLIGRITKNEKNEPLWPDEEVYDNCCDNDLISYLCNQYFTQSRLSEPVLRELARSQAWRRRWDVGVKTGLLFAGPVTSWSQNQLDLAYWSSVYDSVYDAYERPSKEIICDDDLLDSWFINQSEKIDNKHKAPISSKSGRNETFIMADEKGAKRVYDMNDKLTRAKIQNRQKVIDDNGVVAEQNFSDSKAEMKQQLMSKQSRHMRDIRKR